MAKKKTIWKCNKCGYESIGWMGKCSQCNSFGTMEEEVREREGSSKTARASTREPKEAVSLKSIERSKDERIITNNAEFNRALGGGIVKDSVSILTARPGAGKSTLLLQIADDISSLGLKVLYGSGEESESQISSRADRILKRLPQNVWILSDNSMDNLLEAVYKVNPDLIIVDSIQTFSLDNIDSKAGSPVQTVECANVLVDLAKDRRRPRAVIMVGHMTKANEMAGLRTLEHLVDTVLYLEGESEEELRTLMASKNRFGRTGEIGLFSMEENGMIPIDNPSEYFITAREDGKVYPGSALSIIKEGSRLILIEVESLVSKSFTPYPSRIGDCLRRDQLNTLISILEERGKIGMYDKNVVVKTTGGLKLSEQSVNLALIMSMVSSIKNKGIGNDTVFIGDVGLTGELKKVPSIESRVMELDRMGFKRVYIPKGSIRRSLDIKSIEVIEKATLQDLIDDLF